MFSMQYDFLKLDNIVNPILTESFHFVREYENSKVNVGYFSPQ